ncbi:MAG TPA: ABC transporter permease [Lachnospiraceae bacterium]|nr:ABC transporter permease [Lachnospiraceae bacterium]
MFYLKLAFMNLKKNRNAYIPYMFACVGMIFTFFLFMVMSEGKGLRNVPQHASLVMMFDLGKIIISIFAVIFIFYANGFLMKRRKKEIGLYGILGLEKRHVAIVMFFETIFTGFTSIIISLLAGGVFGNIFFLLLMKLTKVASGSRFEVSAGTIVSTVVFFLIVYLATLIWNFIQVKTTKPVELLKGEQLAQKERKSSLLLAIIGFGCLGAGYFIAIRVENPLEALYQFFIAVILVIIGTIYTFRAGSIVVLRALKKNKNFYYKTNNFISISGMIHRMKQNAAGLANICILSTMVLVTISTTIALYIGQEVMTQQRNPYDNTIEFKKDAITSEDLQKKVLEVAEKNHVNVEDYVDLNILHTAAKYEDDAFMAYNDEIVSSTMMNLYDIELFTIDEYNRMENKNETLQQGEILFYQVKDEFHKDTLKIGTKEYIVKEYLDSSKLDLNKDSFSKNKLYVIADNEDTIKAMANELGRSGYTGIQNEIEFGAFWNVEGANDNRLNYANEIHDVLLDLPEANSFTNIDLDRQTGYSIFGGLLFLGLFLGLIFLLAMVLIIYFKQISEGFEDRKRYEILSKVGLDQKSVKKTINKQIIQVFFLPLLGAIVHVAFAFKMITRMLLIFELTDTTLIFLCTLGTIGLFVVIYVLVFFLTAKAYYRIVRR